MEDKKVWERPWSPEEMIKNASKWSLAGDAGLLNYLEQFSENMLSKVEETNDNLNLLTDNLNQVQLSLNVVNNEFMGLHNTQFIESRVYEEDETEGASGDIHSGSALEHSQSSEQIAEDNISLSKGGNSNMEEDEERIADMKEAIMVGLGVIDKYYEKVQVAVDSDSEDDEAPKEILRPKDLYTDRPLPYLIGSEEWYKKWHVGLIDSSSEDEAVQEKEQFSDDDDKNKTKDFLDTEQAIHNITGDSSESYSDAESDLLKTQNVRRPVANSTFNETVSKAEDLFGSDSEEEDDRSVPRTQIPNTMSNFAEQLAAKLGNVVSHPEVNKRPIAKTDYLGNLISDSPPPLDDDLEYNTGKQGLFSSDERGLFDDDDDVPVASDDLFKTPTRIKTEIFPKREVTAAKVELPKPKSQNITSGGLFDDDDGVDDFDDLFKAANVSASVSSYLKPLDSKSNIPLFSELPPDLEPPPPPPVVKKPVGGISVIPNVPRDTHSTKKAGGAIISKPSVPVSSSTEFPKMEDNSSSNLAVNGNSSSKKKPSLLFEDDDDDLFSTGTTGKFTSSLFDSEPPPLDSEPLFGNISSSKVPVKPSNTAENVSSVKVEKPTVVSALLKEEKKNVSLFDDADDLFKAIKKNKPEISLFDDPVDDDDFDDLFAPKTLKTDTKPKIENETEQNTKRNDASKEQSKKIQPKTIKTILFDEVDDDEPRLDKEVEDLFGDQSLSTTSKSSDISISSKSTVVETLKRSENLTSNPLEPPSKVSVSSNKKISLFDDDSPSDKDDLFAPISKPNENSIFSHNQKREFAPRSLAPSVKDTEPKQPKPKIANLFIDDSSQKNDEDDALFKEETQQGSDAIASNSASEHFLDNNIEPGQRTADNLTVVEESSSITVSELGSVQASDVSNAIEDSTAAQTISSLFNSGHQATADRSESGIVKDSATFQSDSSQSTSFLSPIASSSRRYSSTDQTFHDQQREDSLFITKSHLDIPPAIEESSSSLEEATESVLEITPSGNAHDVFSSSGGEDDAAADATLNILLESDKQSAAETGGATVDRNVSAKLLSSLFSDSEEDDLFKVTPKKNRDVSLFGSDDEDLFSAKSSSGGGGGSLFETKPPKTAERTEKKLLEPLFDTGVADKENADKNDDDIQSVGGIDNVDTAAVTPGRIDKRDKSSVVADIFDVASANKNSHKSDVAEDPLKKQTEADTASVSERTAQEMDAANKPPDDENEVQLRPKVTSPGKLKIPNFNINVAALLPGAGPPKRRPPILEKSTSVEPPSNSDVAPTPLPRAISSIEPRTVTSPQTQPKEEEQETQSRPFSVSQMRHSLNINVSALLPSHLGTAAPKKDEDSSENSSVSFENKEDSVETLKSITKDRARVIKRRPSSRKGRQEMIRKSGIDFQVEDLIPDETAESDYNQENPLSSSTEKNDLFAVSKVSEDDLFASQNVVDDLFSAAKAAPIFKDTIKAPFAADESFEEDLFSAVEQKQQRTDDRSVFSEKAADFVDPLNWKGNKPTDNGEQHLSRKSEKSLLPNEKTAPKADSPLFTAQETAKKSTGFSMIFDDSGDDDNDDIFSTRKVSVPKAKFQALNKSLFGDDDEDDDLFGGSSASVSNAGKTAMVKKLSTNTTSGGHLRKKVDVEVIEDPLDALRK